MEQFATALGLPPSSTASRAWTEGARGGRVPVTGKKTPGGAGTHTGHTRDTQAHKGTRITPIITGTVEKGSVVSGCISTQVKSSQVKSTHKQGTFDKGSVESTHKVPTSHSCFAGTTFSTVSWCLLGTVTAVSHRAACFDTFLPLMTRLSIHIKSSQVKSSHFLTCHLMTPC
jgi:hypothetical protein